MMGGSAEKQRCRVVGSSETVWVGLAESGEAHAGVVLKWLAARDGSGIKASVAASCGLRGCWAPQSTRAMLGI